MAARLFDDGLTSNSSSITPAKRKDERRRLTSPTPPRQSAVEQGSAPQKSKRQLKKERKAAEWAERLKVKKKEEAEKGVVFKPTPKDTSKSTQKKEVQKPDEEVAFLAARQQARKRVHDLIPDEAAEKRRKIATELPLLNGMPVKPEPKVIPGPPASEAAKEEPKLHLAQIKHQASKLLPQREQLPIWKHQDSLRRCLRERDVLVMVGQTGSGKSTQLGQFLWNEPWMRRQKKVGGCIAITQPRRVAATNLARRVAAEAGVRLGEEVGYSVRFDQNYDHRTKVKFLTDGMLLQEMLQDPLLRRYSCVVVDEAHERTVDTDLIMGFLRRLVYGERRGTLKVVVMSATMEVEGIARFFEENGGEGIEGDIVKEGVENGEVPVINGVEQSQDTEMTGTNDSSQTIHVGGEAPSESNQKKKRKKKKKKASSFDTLDLVRTPSPPPVSTEPIAPKEATNKKEEDSEEVIPFFGTVALYQVPGRQHPVDVYYAPEPVQDYVDASLRTIFQIHYSEPLPGDVLVFLPGQDDIESLQKLITELAVEMKSDVPKLLVLPLYAALPPHLQMKAFSPTPSRTRKIILSTNIAETSVTVTGVRHVIDCGKSKQKQFRPQLGLESLLITSISQSSALQRAGRAGREAPGKCFRLYTETSFSQLTASTLPEILRCDLSHALLRLKARGCDDIYTFPFLSRPKHTSLTTALESLLGLSALSDTGTITPLGRKMASLPLSPPFARVLLASLSEDCAPEVVDIIAALQQENIFLAPLDEASREAAGDAHKLFRRSEGDHITLLEAVRAYLSTPQPERAEWCKTHFVNSRSLAQFLHVRKQLLRILPEDSAGREPVDTISPEVAERVVKCFLKGFFRNTARLAGNGGYVGVLGGQEVVVHPGSVMMGRKVEAIMYGEVVFTTRPWARWVSAVQLGWVVEAAPAVLGRGF